MSVILLAPLPTPTTMTILPNPEFGDGETPKHSATFYQAMDGTLYSYVKSNDRSELTYTFTLARPKALELRAFIRSYYRAKIRLVNHKNETWEGYLTGDPFEFKSGSLRSLPGGYDPDQSITLTFEGVRVSAPAPESC